MDSYYVLSDSIQENNSICNTVLELLEQKLDTTPPIKENNSVETPSLNDLKISDSTKYMSYDVDVQLVATKAYSVNEIYELKREISQLKVHEKTGKCDFNRYFEISNSYLARTEFFYKISVASKTNNY